jgi:hypothetical protein
LRFPSEELPQYHQKSHENPQKTRENSANKKWAVSPLISPPAGVDTAILADKLVCIVIIRRNAGNINGKVRGVGIMERETENRGLPDRSVHIASILGRSQSAILVAMEPESCFASCSCSLIGACFVPDRAGRRLCGSRLPPEGEMSLYRLKKLSCFADEGGMLVLLKTTYVKNPVTVGCGFIE